MSLTPESIWNYKQNKPRFIARDFELLGIPKNATYKILLTRGVFKWLSARRDIIKLKNIWRDRLTALYHCDLTKLTEKEYTERLGRIKATEECRAELRAICHSHRWRAPDFDKEAVRYLESISNQDYPTRYMSEKPDTGGKMTFPSIKFMYWLTSRLAKIFPCKYFKAKSNYWEGMLRLKRWLNRFY